MTWRRRTHRYLDALFRLDPATAADFHHYQARYDMPPALTVWTHLRSVPRTGLPLGRS